MAQKDMGQDRHSPPYLIHLDPTTAGSYLSSITPECVNVHGLNVVQSLMTIDSFNISSRCFHED